MKEIFRLNNDNAMDFNQAREILLDFACADKTKKFNEQDFINLIPAVYSYCNERFVYGMPDTYYTIYKNKDDITIAGCDLNRVKFNLASFNHLDRPLTQNRRMNILNTLFHEHTHLGDYNDKSKK